LRCASPLFGGLSPGRGELHLRLGPTKGINEPSPAQPRVHGVDGEDRQGHPDDGEPYPPGG
jgi:hypothetical protein